LAFLFQLYGLIYISVFPGLNKNGPFSVTMPIREEHPGPPFNHNITGSSYGDDWLSYKNVVPFKKEIIK